MSVGRVARRTFLIGSAAIAGGLAVGYYFYRRPYENPLLRDAKAGEAVFNPYVRIGPDNRIVIIVPRSEMGQGVQTTLAALVAEELDVPLTHIEVEHGPASWALLQWGSPGGWRPLRKIRHGLYCQVRARNYGCRWQNNGLPSHGRVVLDCGCVYKDAGGGGSGAHASAGGRIRNARPSAAGAQDPGWAHHRPRRRLAVLRSSSWESG